MFTGGIMILLCRKSTSVPGHPLAQIQPRRTESDSIPTHQNPVYVLSQEVTEGHTYETLSLYENAGEPVSNEHENITNINRAGIPERRIRQQSWVSGYQEGTSNTYISIDDSTGDTYVTVSNS